MPSPLERMLAACNGLGLEPKMTGKWWRVKHPCNPTGDEHRSFAFTENPDGTLILASHKPSYSTDDALKILGVTWADMFPTKDERYLTDPKNVCGYEYTDAKGRPVGRVTRTKDKQFPQGHYGPNGKYVSGLEGKVLPLYMLPLVALWSAEGKRIYVVEGEKDARNLIRAGHAATTKPGGAKSEWHECHTEPLRGMDVTIVADRDDAGYEAARMAYLALLPVAASVKIVEPVKGKDSSDHLETGLSVADFAPRDDLVPSIPLVSSSGRVVRCVDVSDVEDARAPEGVPTGFKSIDEGSEAKGLPKGQMTVWAARKKVGKTSGMTQVTAHACKQGYRVLYVTLADLTPAQLWRRMRRQETGWADGHQDLLKQAEWQRTVDNMRAFWELKFADAQMVGGRDVENLVPGIEALHAQNGFDLVVVDYAQKVTSSVEKDRVRAMEKASSDLSYMADKQGFALVVGSQLSDDGRTRYSQEFEDDCGLMVVIAAPGDVDDLRRDFKVPFSRFGPSYEFPAYWNKSKLTFEEESQ